MAVRSEASRWEAAAELIHVIAKKLAFAMTFAALD